MAERLSGHCLSLAASIGGGIVPHGIMAAGNTLKGPGSVSWWILHHKIDVTVSPGFRPIH